MTWFNLLVTSAFVLYWSFASIGHAAPIRNDLSPLPVETQTILLSTFIGFGVLVCIAVILLACVCCPQSGIKVLGHQNGIALPHHQGAVNHIETSSVSEFTIFPPPNAVIKQPTGSYHRDELVTFDPLPDIRPRKLSTSLVHPPRPAHFTSTINRGLSLQDWFEEPSQNFPRSKLQYLSEIGTGWFGKAVEGEAQNILSSQKTSRVIVKILREDASPSEHVYFLYEVRPFRELRHPNILGFLGRCLESDPFLVIMEHCATDLKSFLIERRSNAESILQSGILLSMASNISSALQHMHHHGFIHTDLAARNCLVDLNLSVKIGDYGTAVNTFKEDYYCLGDIALPIRWCAPESLQCTETAIETKEVTKDANVWTFGVLLWELVEMGKMPYMELGDDEVLLKVVVEQSVTLEQPKTPCIHRNKLYQIMMLCWNLPEQRPPMHKLATLVNHLYDNKDVPSDSTAFESRWSSLKPTVREHNLAQQAADPLGVTMTFESDFSGEQKRDSFFSASSDLSSSRCSLTASFDINLSHNMSPSLQNLRGSLEELDIKSDVAEETNIKQQLEDRSIEQQISAAIQDLDNILAGEVTSSETSKDATPERNTSQESDPDSGSAVTLTDIRDDELSVDSREMTDLVATPVKTLSLVRNGDDMEGKEEVVSTWSNDCQISSEKHCVLSGDLTPTANIEETVEVTSGLNDSGVSVNMDESIKQELNFSDVLGKELKDSSLVASQVAESNAQGRHPLEDESKEEQVVMITKDLDTVVVGDVCSVRTRWKEINSFQDELANSDSTFQESQQQQAVTISGDSRVLDVALGCESLEEKSRIAEARPGETQDQQILTVIKDLDDILGDDRSAGDLSLDDAGRGDSPRRSKEKQILAVIEDLDNILSEEAFFKGEKVPIDGDDTDQVLQKSEDHDTTKLDDSMCLHETRPEVPDTTTEETLKTKNIVSVNEDNVLPSSNLVNPSVGTSLDLKTVETSDNSGSVFSEKHIVPEKEGQLTGGEQEGVLLDEYVSTSDVPVSLGSLLSTFLLSSGTSSNKCEEGLLSEPTTNTTSNIPAITVHVASPPLTPQNSPTGEGCQRDSDPFEPAHACYFRFVLNETELSTEPNESDFFLDGAGSHVFRERLTSTPTKPDLSEEQMVDTHLHEISESLRGISFVTAEEAPTVETLSFDTCESRFRGEDTLHESASLNSKVEVFYSAVTEGTSDDLLGVIESDNVANRINTVDLLDNVPNEDKSNSELTSNALSNVPEPEISDGIFSDKTLSFSLSSHDHPQQNSTQSEEQLLIVDLMVQSSLESKVGNNVITFPSNSDTGTVDKLIEGVGEDLPLNFESATVVQGLEAVTEGHLDLTNLSSHEKHSYAKEVVPLTLPELKLQTEVIDFVSTEDHHTLNDNSPDNGRNKVVSEREKDVDGLDNVPVVCKATELQTNSNKLANAKCDSTGDLEILVPDLEVTLKNDTRIVKNDDIFKMLSFNSTAQPYISGTFDYSRENEIFLEEKNYLDRFEECSLKGLPNRADDGAVNLNNSSGFKEEYDLDDILEELEESGEMEHRFKNIPEGKHLLSPSSIDDSGKYSSVSEDEEVLLEDLETGIREIVGTTGKEYLDEEVLVVDTETNEAMLLDSDYNPYNSSSTFLCNSSSSCISDILAGPLESITEESEDMSERSSVVHQSPSMMVSSNSSPTPSNMTEDSLSQADPGCFPIDSKSDLILEGEEYLAGNDNADENEWPIDEDEARVETYTPDFESDTDDTSSTGTSCSSTSGSFECLHSKSSDAKVNQEEEIQDFAGSTWDKDATPTKSAIKSPEKLQTNDMKKSVSFHEVDPPIVYSYPPEPDVSEDEDVTEFSWHVDYSSFADWDLQPFDDGEEIPEDIIEFEDFEVDTSAANQPTLPLSTMMYSITGISDEDLDSLDPSISECLDEIKSPNIEREKLSIKILDQRSAPQFEELSDGTMLSSITPTTEGRAVEALNNAIAQNPYLFIQATKETVSGVMDTWLEEDWQSEEEKDGEHDSTVSDNSISSLSSESKKSPDDIQMAPSKSLEQNHRNDKIPTQEMSFTETMNMLNSEKHLHADG